MAKSKRTASSLSEKNHFGKNLNFAASEAYKLLRTNLMFFTPEGHGRVIGVTSSIVSEGKSTTSINLAYALAESGKKVVLIECDMRRPTIARRLQFESSPGLSNLIIGRAAPSEVLRTSTIHENLSVIPAGDIPPNPSELLGSERMKACLQELCETYDYIVLDLPPVNIVSDALALARMVDGFVFVVRQEHSARQSVIQAMRQLEMVDAKILGFVWNYSAGTEKKGLGRYYRKYGYYRYYSRYGKKKKLRLPAEKDDD